MAGQKLRVLPLGGLGEIGKNMTVVEYDGRIVVVDTGLMFPTAEMLGHRPGPARLLLPARSRRRHRGDRPHPRPRGPRRRAALRAARDRRAAGDLRRPADDRHGPLQARRAQARRRAAGGAAGGGEGPARPLRAGADPPLALDPRHARRPAHHRAGLDADDRRLQVRPDPGRRAARPTSRAWPRSAATACCCSAATRPTPTGPGVAPSESSVGPALLETFSGCEGRIIVTSFASNIHRVQQVIDAAVKLDRRVALVGRSMRKNFNIASNLGIADAPSGLFIQPREIESFPDEKVVVISTGSQGEPLSALRRMANNDHRDVELHSGDTVVFSATPVPGNERAVNETIDRIYEIGATVVTAKDAPIHASGHGWQEELKLMLNLTKPRYVLPVHGDHQRLRLHAELAHSVGIDAGERLPGPQRAAAGDRRERGALRRGHPRRRDLRRRRQRRRARRRRPARPSRDLGRRDLHRRRDDLLRRRPASSPTRR